MNAKSISMKMPTSKQTGFAVGLSEPLYWWITVQADALGISRQELMNRIVADHIGRAAKEAK